MVSAIEVREVTKRFGALTALDAVTLEVPTGATFGFFGPNGAGKTTLLRILTGQLPPTSGEARVLGIDVAADPMAVKRRIGIVPEVESPPTYLTAYEFLHFVGRVREVDRLEDRIARWTAFFGLEEYRDTICRDLSKGTRQKLMFASALLHDPPLLFLDEPFINLDPIYQAKLRGLLVEFTANGGTIFLCSHILALAERLCTLVAFVDRGQLLASGPLGQLVNDGEHLEDVFLRLVGAPPAPRPPA